MNISGMVFLWNFNQFIINQWRLFIHGFNSSARSNWSQNHYITSEMWERERERERERVQESEGKSEGVPAIMKASIRRRMKRVGVSIILLLVESNPNNFDSLLTFGRYSRQDKNGYWVSSNNSEIKTRKVICKR